MFKKALTTVFIGILIFIAFGPFITFTVEGQFDPEIINLDEIEVGEEINNNGYRQIFINYKGDKTLLTTENTTHSAVSWEGEYITWMSQINGNWQIFLHHIPSHKTIQLTSIGNNVNPKINKGNVVWEGQVKGVWQAFVFDGSKVYQITTSTTPIQDVDIENEHIVYSKKRNESKGWDIYYYNKDTKTTKKLTQDERGLNPTIENGIINWETYKFNNLAYYEYDIALDKISLIQDVYITTPESSTSYSDVEGFNVNAYVNFLKSVGRSPTPALKVLLEE